MKDVRVFRTGRSLESGPRKGHANSRARGAKIASRRHAVAPRELSAACRGASPSKASGGAWHRVAHGKAGRDPPFVTPDPGSSRSKSA
jgi:hypothetical protein